MKFNCDACELEYNYLVSFNTSLSSVHPEITHSCEAKSGKKINLIINAEVQQLIKDHSLTLNLEEITETITSMLIDLGFSKIDYSHLDDFKDSHIEFLTKKGEQFDLNLKYNTNPMDEELKVMMRYKHTSLWNSIFLDNWDSNDWEILKVIPLHATNLITKADRVASYVDSITKLSDV